MKLAKSNIIFDAVSHTYTLGDKILHGITGVIKDKLFPNEYDNVPESVLNRAAERGSRIHKVLEMFDLYNITTEHCTELNNYIKAVSEYPFLANHVTSEYLVTDGEQYASAIDKVYSDGKGGVILADIKTTYKLNKDYVSWQLSVYKYFFGLLNPNIKVSGLYVIWLRGDKALISIVQEHSEEEVKQLLYSDNAPKATQLLPEEAFETELLTLKTTYEKAKQAYEKRRDEVAAYLTKNNIQTYKGHYCTITIKSDSVRKVFDTKLFKEEEPTTYNKYLKEAVSKGGLLITQKK